MLIKGHAAIVTGSGSGLGAAIIVASSLYVAHREARLTRRDPVKVGGGRPQPAPPT